MRAHIGDQEVEIDFLWHVKGVRAESLEKQAVEVQLDVKVQGKLGRLILPIMHPLHCLQSRLANVVELKRDTDLALRQLEASPLVLRAYLSDVLGQSRHKHVTSVLQALYFYLITDPSGRQAHRRMRNDPAEVLAAFQDDARLDERWRELSLRSMRATVAERRTAWGAMKARVRRLLGTSEPDLPQTQE